jgi:hypothetical protein
MKLVAFILSIFVSFLCHSQDKTSDELYFDISCGFAAQTSKEIQAFKSIVDLGDTAAIADKLYLGSKLEQILAAIVVRYYQKNASFRLTKDQEKRMREISNLKYKFSLCFTCTFRQKGIVKELFDKKRYLASYSIIEYYLTRKS